MLRCSCQQMACCCTAHGAVTSLHDNCTGYQDRCHYFDLFLLKSSTAIRKPCLVPNCSVPTLRMSSYPMSLPRKSTILALHLSLLYCLSPLCPCLHLLSVPVSQASPICRNSGFASAAHLQNKCYEDAVSHIWACSVSPSASMFHTLAGTLQLS